MKLTQQQTCVLLALDKLPLTREYLMTSTGLSFVPVQRALGELVRAGLVVIEHAEGEYVYSLVGELAERKEGRAYEYGAWWREFGSFEQAKSALEAERE